MALTIGTLRTSLMTSANHWWANQDLESAALSVTSMLRTLRAGSGFAARNKGWLGEATPLRQVASAAKDLDVFGVVATLHEWNDVVKVQIRPPSTSDTCAPVARPDKQLYVVGDGLPIRFADAYTL
jgi:hypothetical protein